MKTILKKKWDKLLLQIDSNPDFSNTDFFDATFEILFQNYFYDTYRYYHNASHINNCLEILEEIKIYYKANLPKKEPNYLAIELAIWFHDFIYDTRKNNNEEMSALAAKQFILGTEDYTIIKNVESLILFTKYNCEPTTIEEKILLDIDLSVLGGYPAEYNDYSENIRKEYYWAPDFVYYFGRLKILEDIINKKQIYYTDYFIDNHYFGRDESIELNARKNIGDEIKYIKSRLKDG